MGLRKIFFFVLLQLLLFISDTIKSQVVSIDYILGSKLNVVKKKTIPKADSIFILEFDFGKSTLRSENNIDSLRDKIIDKIELVYTSYYDGESFQQNNLNRKRLDYLQKLIPHIFNNNLINWELIEQTEAKSAEEAKNYFHGFIVYTKGQKSYKHLPSETEIEILRRSLSCCLITSSSTICDTNDIFSAKPVFYDTLFIADTIYKIPKSKSNKQYVKITATQIDALDKLKFNEETIYYTPRPTKSFKDTIVIKRYKIQSKKERNKGFYLPKSKRKQSKGIVYTKKSIWNRKAQYIIKTDSLLIQDSLFVLIDTCYTIIPTSTPVIDKSCLASKGSIVSDTVVSKALKTIQDWENAIVVEDITGSMYPYLEQTYIWRRTTLGSTKLSKYVFFNDGDNTPDSKKIIGKTGGIYYIDTNDIIRVEQEGIRAMRKGSGSDNPENNIEAILQAQKFCPKCDIVMIADNNAPIKDIILAGQITKPVNIVLCGVINHRIQADYLTLARITNGKIYTMEEILLDFTKKEEGETVKIGDQLFKITDGKYILTR